MNVVQLLVDTLVYGSVLALVALGVNLVYGLLRFANFAHVEFCTVGAFLTYELNTSGVPLVAAVAAAGLLSGVIAVLLHLTVFRSLETQTAASKMIASVGVAIIIRAAVPLFFGGDQHQLGGEPSTALTINGVTISSLALTILGVTLGLMVALHLGLTRTRFGTAIRATAESRQLASTRGVDSERVLLAVWAIAGALAAVAGALVAMQTQVRPSLGLSLMIPVFAAATVGGLGSAYGAVAGAFLIAAVNSISLAVSIGGWELPTDLKDAVALLVLILVLLVRPVGLVRSVST